MKIAIAGPGRSGTTVLTQLFSECGFSVPPKILGSTFFEDAQAGQESPIGSDSIYEVDKDPWAFEYMKEEDLVAYEFLIIPIRHITNAALSRSVQERFNRINSGNEMWRWDHSGTVAGGAIYRTDYQGIAGVLLNGLWNLLEVASKTGTKILILNFPKFVQDFEYAWSKLGNILETKTDKESARGVWARIVDYKKITIQISENKVNNIKVEELEILIEKMMKENKKTSKYLEDKSRELEDKSRELEDKSRRLEKYTENKILRFFVKIKNLRKN